MKITRRKDAPRLICSEPKTPVMDQRIYKIIDIDTLIDSGKYADKAKLLATDGEVYMQMLEEGVSRIKLAKLLHDDMEIYYIGSMDFMAVTELRNKVIERIRGILRSKVNKLK